VLSVTALEQVLGSRLEALGAEQFEAEGVGEPGIVTSSRVHGTKAQAMALARHLLAELSFPPGTKPVHARSLPSLLRDYQGPGAGWAGGQEILVAPGNPRSVLERLDAHVPFSTPARYGPAVPHGPAYSCRPRSLASTRPGSASG